MTNDVRLESVLVCFAKICEQYKCMNRSRTNITRVIFLNRYETAEPVSDNQSRYYHAANRFFRVRRMLKKNANISHNNYNGN